MTWTSRRITMFSDEARAEMCRRRMGNAYIHPVSQRCFLVVPCETKPERVGQLIRTLHSIGRT